MGIGRYPGRVSRRGGAVGRAAVWCLLALALPAAHAAPMAPDQRSPPPLPRDPQMAVQEEFDRAAAAGTRPAWDLFIARHPANRLTPEARRRRDALR